MRNIQQGLATKVAWKECQGLGVEEERAAGGGISEHSDAEEGVCIAEVPSGKSQPC